MSAPATERCYACGKPVDQARAISLELNSSTGIFSSGQVPEADSQGAFTFGPDCGVKFDGKTVSAHRNWLKGVKA